MAGGEQAFVSGVVLAAGFGRRMGGDGSKLLLPLGGEIVLARPVRQALSSRLGEVVIVLGHDHRRILRALAPLLAHPKARVVRNARPEEGRLSSIRVGLAGVDPAAGSALFLCGDHPMVDAGLIDRLLDLHASGPYLVTHPVIGGRKGHPTVWRRETWPALLGLEEGTGSGTGDLARSHGDRVGRLPLEEEGTQLDLNTRRDYARLQELTQEESSA